MTKAWLALTGCLTVMAGAAPAASPAPLHVPVMRENFPDPFVIRHGRTFIGYATNQGVNLPMATSRDLVAWRLLRDPDDPRKPLDGMPRLAPWVEPGRTWAPEVMRVGRRWLLYYTAHDREKDKQCVGVGVAARPTGPFRDDSEGPLVCQEALGGTIDAQPFRDADGRLYLYYKNDGNAADPPIPARIWAQPLSGDGLRLTGKAVPLVRNDRHWEWRVVEAPAMVRRPDGGYTLFFSGNHYGWEPDQRLSNYATGYADCEGPMGPCADSPENPWLRSHDDIRGCLSGPGHPAVFSDGTRSYIGFHAWAATADCRKAANDRYLYIAPLFWRGGKPFVGPSLRSRDR